MGKNGKKARDRGLEAYLEWVQGLGGRWRGHNFLGPYEDKSWFSCGAGWYYDLIYFYYGPKEDAMAEWNDLVDSLKAAGLRDIQTEVTSMATMWENVEKDLQNIYPWTWVPEGVQSVLATRETLEEKTLIMETLPETLELSAEKGQEEGNCVPFPFKTGMRCIYIGRLDTGAVRALLRAAWRKLVPERERLPHEQLVKSVLGRQVPAPPRGEEEV